MFIENVAAGLSGVGGDRHLHPAQEVVVADPDVGGDPALGQ